MEQHDHRYWRRMPEEAKRWQNTPAFNSKLNFSQSHLPFPESGVNHDTRGLHSGKGPKSFKRSDQRLLELICDALADDPHLDATHIEVFVTNGEATLTGIVSDRNSKRLAEDLSEKIYGIVHIENKLRIGIPDAHESREQTPNIDHQ